MPPETLRNPLNTLVEVFSAWGVNLYLLETETRAETQVARDIGPTEWFGRSSQPVNQRARLSVEAGRVAPWKHIRDWRLELVDCLKYDRCQCVAVDKFVAGQGRQSQQTSMAFRTESLSYSKASV